MDNFPFASRTDWEQNSNELTQALESLKHRGISINDLTESNPTRCGFKYPDGLLSALAQPESLIYTADSKGLNSARSSIVKYYADRHLKAGLEQIVLTSSTSEAYSFLLRLLVNPGERVLIPRPSYPLFQFLLELNDCAFDYYPLVYDGIWRLDRVALEALIDADTRAIILVNPNNPTGSYINDEDMAFLNGLCHKNNMAIISDEVFYDYAFKKENAYSCVGNAGALTFVLSGLSKIMALPQMKCSWIVTSGPEDTVKEALNRLEIIADTYLSVNTPVQRALPVWLTAATSMQEQIMSRVGANWKVLQSQTAGTVELLSVAGGWYAILKAPNRMTEEEWVLKFLKEDHVLVHPGFFFDFKHDGYLILSLLPHTDEFRSGIEKILRHFK